MNVDHIVIRKGRNGWDVEAEGRVAETLCWGEMLAQVISLTHADIKYARFRTVTPYESDMEDIRRNTPKTEVVEEPF